MTPADLLESARGVADKAGEGGGFWARTAAHLARQSLEAAVRREIIARGAMPEGLSFSAQLLALDGTFFDRDVARRAAWTWAALSRACHRHSYELPPMQSELVRWMDSVEALLRVAEERRAG